MNLACILSLAVLCGPIANGADHENGVPETFPALRPGFNRSPQVRADVLMVSIPKAEVLAMLPELRDPQKLHSAQEKLLRMVGTREVHLIGWPEVTVQSGQSAETEAFEENRFPFPFDQPIEAQTLSAPPTLKLTREDQALRFLQFAGLIMPDTFETWPIGVSLRVSAVASDDATATTVNVTPRFTRTESIQRFPTTITTQGLPLFLLHPVIRTHQINAQMTLRDGERRLIYVGETKEPEDRITIFILGVKVIAGMEGK